MFRNVLLYYLYNITTKKLSYTESFLKGAYMK
nr:MAG TPA: hypothetical protein [Caudoviricetes sp.]